ncbi:MAG: hypothetical protein ACREQM_17865 [Candidatus Dormibacteraceae bacterium]
MAARLADALEKGEALAPANRRRLLAALLCAYAGERDGSPIEPDRVDAVQVMIGVADLLTAVEVTSFELAAMCNV